MTFHADWDDKGPQAFSTIEKLEALLDELNGSHQKGNQIAVVVWAEESKGTLTVLLGRDTTVVSHVPKSNEPPYLTSVGDREAAGVTTFYIKGHHSEVPQCHVIPMPLGREAVRHFLREGEFLSKIEWEGI